MGKTGTGWDRVGVEDGTAYGKVMATMGQGIRRDEDRDGTQTGRYRKETGQYLNWTGKGPELEGKGMGHDEERAKKVIRRTRDGVLRLVYGINWGRAGTIQVLYTVQ